MKFLWTSSKADQEIGFAQCCLINDDGTHVGGPIISFWDYTCPYAERKLKLDMETMPHTSALKARAKIAYEWSFCYGYSEHERYLRSEGLSLEDAKHLVEECLALWYHNSVENAKTTIRRFGGADEWCSARPRKAPYRFGSGSEMLDALRNNDLYNPDTNTYAFVYNENGSIAVYDWIDREEALRLGALAAESGDYWGSNLGPGGEIYDDPSYPDFDPNAHTSNLEWCEEHYRDGRWYSTAGWFENNKEIAKNEMEEEL